MVSNRFKSSNRFHDVNLSTFYKKKYVESLFCSEEKKTVSTMLENQFSDGGLCGMTRKKT